MQANRSVFQLLRVLVPHREKRSKSQQDEHEELQDHVTKTYRHLRYGLAVIGFLFPLLLPAVGKFWYGIPHQDSMSAYYWAESSGEGPIRSWLTGTSFTPIKYLLAFLAESDGDAPMRGWFIGLLFVLGIFLLLYKGFDKYENRLLNVAGLSAVMVAVFPMGWDCGDSCKAITVHGIFAILLFVCIAAVALVCSGKTLKELPLTDEMKTQAYRRWYKGLGVCMFLFPLFAWAVTEWIIDDAERVIFFVELFGIWAFALYWWIKSNELLEKRAEERIIKKAPAFPDADSPVQMMSDTPAQAEQPAHPNLAVLPEPTPHQ